MASHNMGRGKIFHSAKENSIRQVKGGASSTNVRDPRNKRNSTTGTRTALGCITNNVRVQPSRAAKASQDVKADPRQDENAGIPQKVYFGGNKSRNQQFSVFVDPNPEASYPGPRARQPLAPLPLADLENRSSSLCDNVVRLPGVAQVPPRVPLLQNNAHYHYLDMSGVEEEETIDDEADVPSHSSFNIPSDAAMEDYSIESVIEGVEEYAEDIYSYLRRVEMLGKPGKTFMDRQVDVTLPMRSILVDWLVEVAEEYKLQRETLFLTVEYIDRFLTSMSVQRNKLQLVGAAAMFLAAKYEEIYPPDVNEFVYITDDTYQKKQILRMEHMILKTLRFQVTIPTINWFAERLLRSVGLPADAGPLPDVIKHLTMYLCELVLVDMSVFIEFEPSRIAACALCLACHTLCLPNHLLNMEQSWWRQCEVKSGYSHADLTECLHKLQKLHAQAPKHAQQAIREKYKQEKFAAVAELNSSPLGFEELQAADGPKQLFKMGAQPQVAVVYESSESDLCSP